MFIYENRVYDHNIQAALSRMVAKNTQQLLDSAQVNSAIKLKIFFLKQLFIGGVHDIW